MKEILERFDNFFIKIINGRMKNKFLDSFMYRITDLGGAIFTSLFSIAIILFGNASTRIIGLEAILTMGIAQTIVQILKRGFGRERPYNMIENINTFKIELKDFSFPSGHTTASFSIATILALNITQISLLVYFLAFIIGVSRIYLAVHYPSDVIVGIVLGVVPAMIVHFLLNDFVLDIGKLLSLI